MDAEERNLSELQHSKRKLLGVDSSYANGMLMMALSPRVRDKVHQAVEEYAETGRLTAALNNNGVTYCTHYALMKGDPEYVRAIEVAREFAVSELEGAVYQRALAGSEEATKIWLRGNSSRYAVQQVKQESNGSLDVVVTYEEPGCLQAEPNSDRRALPPA